MEISFQKRSQSKNWIGLIEFNGERMLFSDSYKIGDIERLIDYAKDYEKNDHVRQMGFDSWLRLRKE